MKAGQPQPRPRRNPGPFAWQDSQELFVLIQFDNKNSPNLPNIESRTLRFGDRGTHLKHHTFNDAAVVLAGANAAAEFLEPIFSERDQEIMNAAYCDDRLRLIELISFPGLRDSVEPSIPEIFRFRRESGGILLAHNHPSGVAVPSQADMNLTHRILLVAEALNMTLLDHLIFGCGRVFSFRQSGLL